MDLDENTRRRSPNFSKEERICLLRIVKVFEKYIEEKKTDSSSNRLKNGAWTKVRIEFNKRVHKINGKARDTLCLKTKYTDLKKSFNRAMRGQGKLIDEYRDNIVDNLLEFETTEALASQQMPLEIKKEPFQIDECFDMNKEEYAEEDTFPLYKDKVHKRSANYTIHETVTLISLVKKYRDIVLDKRAEGLHSKRKIEQWKKIAKEFNDQQLPSAPRRSGPRLREKLNDMKKRFRRKMLLSPDEVKHDSEFVLLKSVLGDCSSNEDDLDTGDVSAVSSRASSHCGEETSFQNGGVGVENEAKFVIEDIVVKEEEDHIADDIYASQMNGEDEEEDHHNDDDNYASVPQTKGELGVEPLSVIDQYYFDKNRREEEEHKLQTELLKIKIQIEKMQMERALNQRTIENE